MKLKHIQIEMPIEVSAQRLWEVLTHYGDVAQFHAGVVTTHAVGTSPTTAAMGCERVCNIVDMGLKIILKERIVDYVEGQSYRYEVYEWKNFPLRKMLFGFRIVPVPAGPCRLVVEIDYRASPGWLTPLLAGKMRRLARDVLLGYKHFAETGERRVPIKELHKRYRSADLLPAAAEH